VEELGGPRARERKTALLASSPLNAKRLRLGHRSRDELRYVPTQRFSASASSWYALNHPASRPRQSFENVLYHDQYPENDCTFEIPPLYPPSSQRGPPSMTPGTTALSTAECDVLWWSSDGAQDSSYHAKGSTCRNSLDNTRVSIGKVYCSGRSRSCDPFHIWWSWLS
jgi:hypothetical protein